MEPAAVAFRFLLASILLISGLAKLRRRSELVRAVDGYRLFPDPLVGPVAAALAPLELAIGLLLAFGLVTRYAAIGALALLGLFTAGILVNLVRGREIDCGCFGLASRQRISWATVARNGGLVLIATTIAIEAPTTLALDSLYSRRPGALAMDEAGALALAATLALAITAVARGAWRLRAQIATVLERREVS